MPRKPKKEKRVSDQPKRIEELDPGAFSVTRLLSRLKLAGLIIGLVELLLVGLVAVLYYLDAPEGFVEGVNPWYWLLAIGIIAIFDICFIWIAIYVVGKKKHATDLQAASVLGSDVQEAYKFGEIGLVVTDDEGCVIWTNSFFRERSLDILDINIFDWQPKLKNFLDANLPSDFKVEFDCGSLYFSVRYLTDAHLFIFRDMTNYHVIEVTSENNRLVIGFLMIDNYDEKFERSEEGNSDVLTNVRQAIIEYAKDHDIGLRRYRSDAYFLVCHYSALHSVMEDQFSILEKVRKAGEGQNFIPTLSIGMAYGIDIVGRLTEMATNALNIAMSRGGDQAVVAKAGDDLAFFGGKTPSVENTNRVQFRSLADSVLTLIKSAPLVMVSGHSSMDMDAFGACLGIYALCQHVGKNCKIVYDMKDTELKTRSAIQSVFGKGIDKLTISPSEAEERIKSNTLFIVVDVSNPNNIMGRKAFEKATKVVVIDHHRPGDNSIEHPILNHTDSSASSTCEILAEMIHYANGERIELPSVFATFMLSGMFLDTNGFKNQNTGARTFEAAEILKGYGADNVAADSYLKDDFEELYSLTALCSRVVTPETGVVYVCTPDDEKPMDDVTISKLSDYYMKAKGIHASFAIGRIASNTVKISGRSDGTINVQLLIERLGGGGRFTAAAAVMNNIIPSAAAARLEEVLRNYLDQARAPVPQEKSQRE